MEIPIVRRIASIYRLYNHLKKEPEYQKVEQEDKNKINIEPLHRKDKGELIDIFV